MWEFMSSRDHVLTSSTRVKTPLHHLSVSVPGYFSLWCFVLLNLSQISSFVSPPSCQSRSENSGKSLVTRLKVSPLICYKDTLPARLVIIIVIVIVVFVILFAIVFVSVFVLVIVFVSPLIHYNNTLPARLVIIIVLVIVAIVIVFWLSFMLPLLLSLSLCNLWYATKTRYLTMAMIWFWSSFMLLCPNFLASVKNCSTLLDLWKLSPPVCECPWRLLIATIILPSLSLSPLWVTLKTIISLLRNQRQTSL